MNRLKPQAGRSMIEMLGVLAIAGVLSVGALVGYSMAMANYKANQAIEEIEKIIMGTQSLYENKNNYDGISKSILQSAEVMPSYSMLKLDFGDVTALSSSATEKAGFRITYPIAPAGSANRYTCLKLVTSPWLRNNESRISITRIDLLGSTTPIGANPTFSEQLIACNDIQTLLIDVRP